MATFLTSMATMNMAATTISRTNIARSPPQSTTSEKTMRRTTQASRNIQANHIANKSIAFSRKTIIISQCPPRTPTIIMRRKGASKESSTLGGRSTNLVIECVQGATQTLEASSRREMVEVLSEKARCKDSGKLRRNQL